jgi:DNA mismatch endonuclease (patch repair protein)
MRRQRRRDTKPEMQVRRLLHAAGVRFRVDVKLESDLRVRGDIVWHGRKVVVFMDGCFWHGCPTHATQPKANAAWWRAKLAANIIRDVQTDAELAGRGWTVLRYWEHEAPADVVTDIVSVVRPR